MENLELENVVKSVSEEEIDRNQLLEWLDALVDNLEQQEKLQNFHFQIRTTHAINYIQIYEGIEKIAKLLDVKLKERTSGKYYQYSLVYRNIEFLQLSKKKW